METQRFSAVCFLASSAKRLIHAVGTFRVNEDDCIASQNGLRHNEVQHHAFTGLSRSDNEQAAFKVFEGSAQCLLGRVQPVKIRHADFFRQLSLLVTIKETMHKRREH